MSVLGGIRASITKEQTIIKKERHLKGILIGEIFSVIAFVGVVLYFVTKYGEAFAQLNNMQKFGVVISFIMTTIVTGFGIYYGSSFLVEHFQNGFFILITRVTVVIVLLWLAAFTLNYLLQKITKGVFPKIT